VAGQCGDGKQAANWMTQDVLREMHERNVGIRDFPLRAAVLANLLQRTNKKQITIKSAREVFMELLIENPTRRPVSSTHIDQIIAEKRLAIVTDRGELERVIGEVVGKNPKAVADFKSGKQAAVGALIG